MDDAVLTGPWTPTRAVRNARISWGTAAHMFASLAAGAAILAPALASCAAPAGGLLGDSGQGKGAIATRHELQPRYMVRVHAQGEHADEAHVSPDVPLQPAFAPPPVGVAVGKLVARGAVLVFTLVLGSSTEVADGERVHCRDAELEGDSIEVCVDRESLEQGAAFEEGEAFDYTTAAGDWPLPEVAEGTTFEEQLAACEGTAYPEACRRAIATFALMRDVIRLNREWHELGRDHWKELLPEPAEPDREAAAEEHHKRVEDLIPDDPNEKDPDCERLRVLRKSAPYVPAVPCGDFGDFCATLLVCQVRIYSDIVVSAEEVQVPPMDRLERVAAQQGLGAVVSHMNAASYSVSAHDDYYDNAQILVRLVEVGFDRMQAIKPGGYYIHYAPFGDPVRPHAREWYRLASQTWMNARDSFLGSNPLDLFDITPGTPPHFFGPEYAQYVVPRGTRALLGVRLGLLDLPRDTIAASVFGPLPEDLVILYPANHTPPPIELIGAQLPTHVVYDQGTFRPTIF